MRNDVSKSMVILAAAALFTAPAVEAQRGGGFQLAPLLMESDAFPDERHAGARAERLA